MPCSQTPNKAGFSGIEKPTFSVFMPPLRQQMPFLPTPKATPLATLAIKTVPWSSVPQPSALCPGHGVLTPELERAETPIQLPALPKRGRPKAEPSQNSTGEGPPGTMWLYTLSDQVGRNQPEYAGELDFGIMENYASSNPAARVSSATLATVRLEFAATDRFRSRLGRMEGRRKKGLQGVCEWRPELLYKTFVDCKPDFFDGSEYADHVPLALCFGMINLRLPNAWRRRTDGVARASRGARAARQYRTRASRVHSTTPANPAPANSAPAPGRLFASSENSFLEPPLVSALASRKRPAMDASPERQRKRVAFALDSSDLATPRTLGLVPQFVSQAAFEAAQAIIQARRQGRIQW